MHKYENSKQEKGCLLLENLKKIQFHGGADSKNVASNIDEYLYGK